MTQTATNHSTIAYVTINNPILTSRTLINLTLPNPTPTKPYPPQPYPHQSLIDAVQPMFRLCQSALTNHGGPVRQSCTVSTHGVS